MKSRAKVAGFAALAAACTPVVSSAANLFSENFNGGTAADRFQAPIILDRAGTTDARAIHNFNYGNYKYWHISADGQTQDFGEFIPQAPRTLDPLNAPKIGLLLDANNIADAGTPNTAQIDIYPKLTSYNGGVAPSGDYKLTFDLFMNYNGRLLGGGGSTEFMKAGINQTGTGIGGLVLTGNPGQAGQSIAISGEGQNGQDYRMYQSNNRYLELDSAAGYVAVDQGPSAPGPAGADNPYYQSLFTFTNPGNTSEAWYENTGAPGKHWTTVEIRYVDGIVYTYMRPAGAAIPPGTDGFTLMSARTDTSAASGHIMFGYADTFNGIADLETGDGSVSEDANFAIFDNIEVDTVAQTRQKWAVAGTANWSNPNAWLNGDVADGVAEVADFTTTLGFPQVVTVDSPRTVRSLVFDSSPHGYTIAGTNEIALNSLTSGIRGNVKVVSGSHVISAPLRLQKPTTFDVAAGASLKVDNLIVDIITLTDYTAAANPLLKTGAGVAEVNVIRNASSITINAGTLKVTPNGTAAGVSVIPTLNITGTGKLDLTNNKLITPTIVGTFTAGAYTGVSGLVDAGRGAAGNALWDGATGIVTTDSRALNNGDLISLGVVDASDKFRDGLGAPIAETATAVFAGQTVLGSDTLVMATWGGDANLDGKINIDDYGQIDSNVSKSGTVFGWFVGDFNYDGKINIDDYGIIDGNIGRQTGTIPTGGGSALDGAAAVPEPASLGLIALAAAAGLRRRRRGNC